MTQFKHSCGIWHHITSLNGKRGCGTLGVEANEFVNMLSESGVSIWQILPINPVRSIFNFSPYSPASSFAGNPLLLDEERIVKENNLDPSVLSFFPDTQNSSKCMFQERWKALNKLLWLAYDRVEDSLSYNKQFQKFVTNNHFWLEDYAIFETLTDTFNSSDWRSWPNQFSKRDNSALNDFRHDNLRIINWYRYVQYLFQVQWDSLKNLCKIKKVKIFGDIPIYPHFDSSDVWSNISVFQIDQDTLHPTQVAGVPPDYFSEEGQLWGNPLYQWFNHEKLQQQTLFWWNERLKRSFSLYDFLRIDHFRAFESYWSVPSDQKNARSGIWEKGPGIDFFKEIEKKLGPDLPIIAEDLGIITEQVNQLRMDLDIPGMKIFQFAFGTDVNHPYLPHNIQDQPCFFYLGTHDNNTTNGWLSNELSSKQKLEVEKYVSQSDQQTLVWKMIDVALSSKARIVILSVADILEYSDFARLNIPGKATGNWVWKVTGVDLYPALSELHKLIVKSHRTSKPSSKLNIQ